MRTAALFKFSAFVILGRNKYDTRGAVGASRYIDVQKLPPMMAGDRIRVDALREYFCPISNTRSICTLTIH